jgi:hypothetical protein
MDRRIEQHSTLQAGDHGFDPGHAHQKLYPTPFCNLRCNFGLRFLSLIFLEHLEQFTAASSLFPRSPEIAFGSSNPYSTRF